MLIPVSNHLHPADIEQRMDGLRCRFPKAEILTVPTTNIPPLMDGDSLAVFAEMDDGLISPKPTYRVNRTGQVLPSSGTPIGTDDLPFLNTHPFNRLGPRGQGDLDFGCFHYFPYGYLYRLAGLGYTNPFGHRINIDFRNLRERPSNHKVIACFGGSAVWSICTTPQHSFPSVMQDLLEEKAEKENSPIKISVLNFGVPGAVVLNEMQHFLLYAADLKPDIVIAHDGANDLFYGCTSDPWLTREYGIVYQQQLEYWAAMLHDPKFRGNANLGGPIVPPTDLAPIHILRAYIRRKREFMTLVRGFCSKFVWGLQPFAWSKKRLSPLEEQRVCALNSQTIAYEAEFHTIRGLYNLLKPEQLTFGADVLVDFDDIFSDIDYEETVMADMIHLDKNGDRKIAQVYADILWPLLTV